MAGLGNLRRERSERLNQAVARRIALAILKGILSPGQQLAGEIEAAERLGVSRTAYREALRQLAAKGMIESRPKAGTRVTQRSAWQLLDPEILAWMFSDKPDDAFVRHLFELREIIEPAAARLAAERRSPEQVAAMAEALDEMRASGLVTERGQAADRQFHRILLEASGNDALATLAGSVGAAVQWTTRYKQMVSPSPRDPIPDHERVLAAIADQDPARAGQAMRDLLDRAFEDMRVVTALQV